jgi:hypothetical protein
MAAYCAILIGKNTVDPVRLTSLWCNLCMSFIAALGDKIAAVVSILHTARVPIK